MNKEIKIALVEDDENLRFLVAERLESEGYKVLEASNGDDAEKIILQVKTMREICCHTGGSIAFGKDHTLFLSTGDNTSPFDEDGVAKGAPNTHSFAPLDDRPGHETNDDRRSAGNTNDLRGKILRIKIKPDGRKSF